MKISNQNLTLLVIAHGSRKGAWNRAIQEFTMHLRALHGLDGPFVRFDAAFMEMASPSIPEAISQLAPQSDALIVLPLFLSISKHLKRDVPKLVAEAATLKSQAAGVRIYERNGVPVLLLPSLSTPPLLARSAANRILIRMPRQRKAGVVLVYYGTQSHKAQWESLAADVDKQLAELLPGTQTAWSYGGEMVDFSPKPLAETVDRLAKTCDRVAIVPALVARGVIQNEVIPAALEEITLRKKVVYLDDAILPDPDITRAALEHALKYMKKYSE